MSVIIATLWGTNWILKLTVVVRLEVVRLEGGCLYYVVLCTMFCTMCHMCVFVYVYVFFAYLLLVYPASIQTAQQPPARWRHA